MINLFVRRLLKCRLMNRNLIPLLNALKKTGVQSKKSIYFKSNDVSKKYSKYKNVGCSDIRDLKYAQL